MGAVSSCVRKRRPPPAYSATLESWALLETRWLKLVAATPQTRQLRGITRATVATNGRIKNRRRTKRRARTGENGSPATVARAVATRVAKVEQRRRNGKPAKARTAVAAAMTKRRRRRTRKTRPAVTIRRRKGTVAVATKKRPRKVDGERTATQR